MKQYLILFRPYGMLFLGFAHVFGAISVGEFSPFKLMVLFIIGVFAHIFTFVQNDYYDQEIDQHSKYVKNRPLSSGRISQRSVIIIFVTSFIISLLLMILLLFSMFALFTLILAFCCVTLYNKYSKRFAGMEYILSMGVFCFTIFGAFTVSSTLSLLTVIVALFGFLQWLFSVGVSANLKDVEFDTKQGISTTPTVFGAHVSGGSLIIPFSFKVYAFGIKIFHVFLAFLVMFSGYGSFSVDSLPIPGFLFIIVTIVLLYLTHNILVTPLEERDSMLRYVGVQEGLSFLLLPISLMSFLILNISLLSTSLLFLVMIVWPLAWFRCLFGRRLIPLE